MDAREFDDRLGDYRTSRDAEIPDNWLAEFEAAARRPLEMRFRYGDL